MGILVQHWSLGQAIDPFLQTLAVVADDRDGPGRIALRVDRQPVLAVVSEQRFPFVVPALIEQPRFGEQEALRFFNAQGCSRGDLPSPDASGDTTSVEALHPSCGRPTRHSLCAPGADRG